ncbi:hypothetical protein diail_2184, partial [Diaporthe ilicicola]
LADGVRSPMRDLLAEKTDGTDAAAAKKMRECYESTYHATWASLLPQRMSTHRENRFCRSAWCTMSTTEASLASLPPVLPVSSFLFLFVKSDQVTKTPNTPRFTEEQTLATIAKYGNHALGPGYTFKDLWDSRVQEDMMALEEGVLQTRWNSGGRVVLLGDAVDDAIVKPGLGGNLAVEGVVHLMNELVPLLRRCEEDGKRKPTSTEVAAMFGEYEKKRRPHADLIVNASGYITSYEAMDSWWLTTLRPVSPWVSDHHEGEWFCSIPVHQRGAMVEVLA